MRNLVLVMCAASVFAADRGTKGGWITVRLEGAPSKIGFQHGSLLAAEIEDTLAVVKLEMCHDGKHDWAFFRKSAQEILWPRIEQEYREELQGIVDGLHSRGVKADVWDIIALNAFQELPYYTAMLDKSAKSAAPEKCSAFVATGKMTRDGLPVIGHNNWSSYMEGARWNVIFDIRPTSGYRILMDGLPGLIHSGDDFGVNSAGIVITETTISNFHGFSTNGVAEFVRARKAMQYASSIDDFARIMRAGNNGGYANTWLVADMHTGEIARLELGLMNMSLERTRDGYFVGANFPINPSLIAQETDYRKDDASVSGNVRRARWEQLMREYAGKIDVEAGKKFLGDHYDAFEGKADAPSERTLCGHIELSPRGMKPWMEANAPTGAVQAKITDATMALKMQLDAAWGHSCGLGFSAAELLATPPAPSAPAVPAAGSGPRDDKGASDSEGEGRGDADRS